MPGARMLYEAARSVSRNARSWGFARSLTDLAYIDCERGNHSPAQAEFREALETFASLGHRRGTARALEGAACLAVAQGHAAALLKLAAAASHLRKSSVLLSIRPSKSSSIRPCTMPGSPCRNRRVKALGRKAPPCPWKKQSVILWKNLQAAIPRSSGR